MDTDSIAPLSYTRCGGMGHPVLLNNRRRRSCRLVSILAFVMAAYQLRNVPRSKAFSSKLSFDKQVDCLRVCQSSTCSKNGSELLLDALQALQQQSAQETREKKVAMVRENCLGGCGKGIVLKVGTTATTRRAVQSISSEGEALQTASELLRDIGALDGDQLVRLKGKLEAGERIFEAEAPELCVRCGVGLQLYRGNCAKCGKYPY